MTELRCVCGATLEGTDEELLAAVERHLAKDHLSSGPVPKFSLGDPRATLRGPLEATKEDQR
jgi:hypothetical protein